MAALAQWLARLVQLAYRPAASRTREKSTLAAMALVALLLAGPSVSCSTSCTKELRSALVVTTLNTSGTEVCSAKVTAKDGGYSTTLEGFGAVPPCPHLGAWQRKGTYTVTVQLGALTKTVSDVRVTADACHVHPRRITVSVG